MKEAENLATRTAALRELLFKSKTLLLSTASEIGTPEQSYAPFVRDGQGHFYIYISELARHTAHLMENPKASIMFIRTEAESPNLFARERVVFQCSARIIEPSDAIFSDMLDVFQNEFGEVINLLRSLSDFHLFALMPDSGRYVAGFGQAFNINSTDDSVLTPLTK